MLFSTPKNTIDVLKKYRYYIVGVVFLIVLSVIAIIWMSHNTAIAKQISNDVGADESKYVQVFKINKVRFKDKINGLMGAVRGSSIELRSSQEEKLTKYHYKVGAYVKKGELIAELDHSRTKSRLRQEEISLNRKKKLFQAGGISEIEIEAAEESYNIAKKDYEDTFIRAIKNGYLGEILLQEGELVNRQTPIAYFVSAEDSFFIETSVIEKKSQILRKGQQSDVYLEVFGDISITGEVMSVSPEATTTSRMIPVRIKISDRYKNKLKPGMSASCNVVVFDKEVLVIPVSALTKDNNVYRVSEGKAQLVSVDLGYVASDYVAVKKGLNEEDVIVTNPEYSQLSEGSLIKYGKVEEYDAES